MMMRMERIAVIVKLSLKLKLSLCDNSDAHILVQKRLTITGAERAGDDAARRGEREADKRNKVIIFKSCTLFTICLSKINNIQVYNAKDLDVVMPMYNLMEYCDNF